MTFAAGAGFWIATYLQVFAMGFQSRNVAHGHFAAAALTSCGIGAAQLFTIHLIAQGNPWALLPLISTAGAAGITSSMFVHMRLFPRR